MPYKYSENLDDYLKLSLRLAKQAGDVIKRQIGLAKRFETKSVSADCVTETDKECEALILSGIAQAFPSHKVIGEESHKTGSSYDLGGQGDVVWIVVIDSFQ